MPNHRKRRKVECIHCHRTVDSDYLTRHNRKYHAGPYKDAGAPANPFRLATDIYLYIYIFNVNHLKYSKIEIFIGQNNYWSEI